MIPHLACFIQTALLPARSLAWARSSSVPASVFWAVAEGRNCKAAAAGRAERKNDRRDQRFNSSIAWISLSDGSGQCRGYALHAANDRFPSKAGESILVCLTSSVFAAKDQKVSLTAN